MNKKWFLELEENNIGRDFIVGDLHGHYSKLIEGLNKINFDTEKDRLFCVGDLVDRGSEVEECLMLLREKWFFSVMGNHEYMVLSKFGEENKIINRIQSFLYNDGKQTIRNSNIFKYISDIKSLPVIIKINNKDNPFYIIHSSRPTIGKNLMTDKDLELIKDKPLFYKTERKMLWNRKLPKEAMKINNIKKDKKLNHLFKDNIQTNTDYILSVFPVEPGISITYSGHTIMSNIVIHRSHVFIDGGMFKGGDLRIVEHKQICEYISQLQEKSPN